MTREGTVGLPRTDDPPVDREDVPEAEAERFREAVASSTTFQRVATAFARFQDNETVTAEGQPVERLVAPDDGGPDRLALRWEGSSPRAREVVAYAERADADEPRVLGREVVLPGSEEGPIDLEPISEPIVVRYYADESTLLRGDEPIDQVAIGLEISSSAQLDTVTEEVLPDPVETAVPPTPELEIVTSDPDAESPVEFSAVGSTPGGAAPIVRYEWIFETGVLEQPLRGPREGAALEAEETADAGTVVYDETRFRTEYSYASPGEYEVALIVVDADGNRAIARETVEVGDATRTQSAVTASCEIARSPHDSHRFTFLSTSSAPEDDPIDTWEWDIDGLPETGRQVTYDFREGKSIDRIAEMDPVQHVRHTVTTESGESDSVVRRVTLPGRETHRGDRPAVDASIARLTAVDAERLSGRSNPNTHGGERYAVPSHGPQVVEPGETVVLTAADSVLPATYERVRTFWYVYELDYGLPDSYYEVLFDDDALAPFDPDSVGTPYPYLIPWKSDPLNAPFRDVAELEDSVTREVSTKTTVMEKPFELQVPADPEELWFEHEDYDVAGYRPALLVRLELEVQFGDDTEIDDLTSRDNVSVTDELLVYLDVSDGVYDREEGVDTSPTELTPEGDSHRWTVGRPGIPGYQFRRTFAPSAERLGTRDPVLVPTRTPVVDYLYVAGGDLNRPSEYQREIGDEVDVTWLSFEPYGWGAPLPERRAFVPLGRI